jgi:RHS repeat-associated protein
VYYIHSDHLDTPRVVTNAQNQVIWQNPPLSEPFGSGAPDEDPDGDATPFTLNLRFPGQYFNQEINAHYNYYRDHYFPSLGRYGQSDPIGLLGGINTYAYVNGSPLRWGDPLGLYCGSGILGAYIPNSPSGFPFNQCCFEHDNCYGNKCGPPKDKCDADFYQCMLKVCEDYQGKARESCMSRAKLYLSGVESGFGTLAFNKARGIIEDPVPLIEEASRYR